MMCVCGFFKDVSYDEVFFCVFKVEFVIILLYIIFLCRRDKGGND